MVPCGIVAALVSALPLILTYLFLEVSNRPEIAFSEAARGSLHPASLLTGVVADLFGAFDPAVPYWGPYSEAWDKNELTLTQNMSQIYVGTLPMLLVLTVGVMRGTLWSREMRFYAVGLAVLLLYALGTHTPAFALFFNYLPGVSFFRRPVDAVFLDRGPAVDHCRVSRAPVVVLEPAVCVVPQESFGGRPGRRDPARCPRHGVERRQDRACAEAADVGDGLDRGVRAAARDTDRVVRRSRLCRRPAGSGAGERPGAQQRAQRVDGACRPAPTRCSSPIAATRRSAS